MPRAREAALAIVEAMPFGEEGTFFEGNDGEISSSRPVIVAAEPGQGRRGLRGEDGGAVRGDGGGSRVEKGDRGGGSGSPCAGGAQEGEEGSGGGEEEGTRRCCGEGARRRGASQGEAPEVSAAVKGGKRGRKRETNSFCTTKNLKTTNERRISTLLSASAQPRVVGVLRLHQDRGKKAGKAKERGVGVL